MIKLKFKCTAILRLHLTRNEIVLSINLPLNLRKMVKVAIRGVIKKYIHATLRKT